MRATKSQIMTLWVMTMMLLPIALMPTASAWEPGDEEEIFGHTFEEEYWTNDSIHVETATGNASLTTSYVHVDEFSAFLIAFNRIFSNDSGADKEIIMPYQLFGMHFKTPENQEVFIGAIFAFLMVHNETFGNNDLPDVGNEPAWYIVPFSTDIPWEDVTPDVEAIPAEKLGENHYRFGMRYTNLSARVVDANSAAGFWITLAIPILTILFSELVIEYDIRIDDSGEVHAETLYTIGQVTRARWWLQEDTDPSSIIVDTMKISAVHYLSIFTSNYNVTRSSTGNTIASPTDTIPLDDNITIRVGDDNERAFDIGLGRHYALINETTDPWTTVSPEETALNALLGARASDFVLIAWQAPLSIWLFAHMAYGLSAQVRATYNSVQSMTHNAGTAFHNSQWWYAVSFPEWHGLRVQQDPVYVAYTSLGSTTEPLDSLGTGGLLLLGGVVAVIVVLVIIIRRR